ncbi:MAG TPA: hypothetical protein VIJ77_00575 [Candidatus Tumulicola sp.]
MKGRRCVALGALAALLAFEHPMPAAAVTSGPQVRHLVYSFTWGTTNDTEVHTSGIGMVGNPGAGMNGSGSASGTVSSTGGASDKGTITVDVVRVQPDGGLVVSVSEAALERRSAPSATCVAFGDTTVVCDSSKKINAEELALLRFLGSNFIDPNQIDANRHWQERQQSATRSAAADFTIAKNAGGVMTINESSTIRDTSGGRPQTSDVTGTIGYDFGRTIPTSIDEYTILRSEAGEQYQTVKTQTVLQLRSDTSAKP